MSAAVCSNFQCRGKNVRSASTKPFAGLIVLALLAIIALASVRPSPDPVVPSQLSREAESGTSDASAILLSPRAGAAAIAVASFKAGKPRILRITP